ncbi:hypothetical protein [Aurantiacibacter luteus]|uniref:Uncharacterized protein n=1 Tax=Aurantiacibacter luteus TaxID=1581420 RepID=A0A0G9MXA4_9SPHN|nr:hypothetical protein [Aurantiacibacter luteus]KLE33903.1 hypothetical protein AAW00_12630 [Aurantiacibacter luteus]
MGSHVGAELEESNMRFIVPLLAACVALVAGCEEEPEPSKDFVRQLPVHPVPPPRGYASSDTVPPPPVAPPPPLSSNAANRWDWCGTQIPPQPRPRDAPSRAECEAHYAETLAQLRSDILADDADLPDASSLPPFNARRDPSPEIGSWMQRLTPSQSGGCSFTERPASARPAGLKVLASSGNMDLLGQGNLLVHDHAIGFVESTWTADRPVIAARMGMADLWIRPLEPWDEVTLIVGADRFYCHRRGDD